MKCFIFHETIKSPFLKTLEKGYGENLCVGCGRCTIGNLYICKDGPVFSYAQLENTSYEL